MCRTLIVRVFVPNMPIARLAGARGAGSQRGPHPFRNICVDGRQHEILKGTLHIQPRRIVQKGLSPEVPKRPRGRNRPKTVSPNSFSLTELNKKVKRRTSSLSSRRVARLEPAEKGSHQRLVDRQSELRCRGLLPTCGVIISGLPLDASCLDVSEQNHQIRRDTPTRHVKPMLE